jgi:hypothetical protein
MSRPRTLAALVALTLPLALAPAAHADAFDKIFKDYQSTGTIDACKYSEAELKQAKSEVPNDIEAYAPDFPNALQGALEQRAGGACDTEQPTSTTPAATPGTVTPPTTTTPTGPTTPAAAVPPTTTPAPPSDPTASAAISDDAIAKTALTADTSDAGTPAPVIALGVLGALLALGGLIYGLVHCLGFDPRWTHRVRHAVAEAGWRTGNTWSEFADWVRIGR